MNIKYGMTSTIIIIKFKPFNFAVSTISRPNVQTWWFCPSHDFLFKRKETRFGKSAVCLSKQNGLAKPENTPH